MSRHCVRILSRGLGACRSTLGGGGGGVLSLARPLAVLSSRLSFAAPVSVAGKCGASQLGCSGVGSASDEETGEYGCGGLCVHDFFMGVARYSEICVLSTDNSHPFPLLTLSHYSTKTDPLEIEG
jgi:hypothetical protein